MKKLLCVLFALLLTVLPAQAAIPQPGADVYVTDLAGVLTEETKQHILTNVDALNTACGEQIAVVIVLDTDGQAIDDYAHELFNSWGIGSEKNDCGSLILLAISDDDYYLVVGDGLQKTLTGGQLKLLLDDYLEPDFAKGNYDAGVRKLFDALFQKVARICGTGLALQTAAPSSNGNTSGKTTTTTTVRTTVSPRTTKYTDYTSKGTKAGDTDKSYSSGSAFLGFIVLVLIFLFSRGSRRSSYRGGGSYYGGGMFVPRNNHHSGSFGSGHHTNGFGGGHSSGGFGSHSSGSFGGSFGGGHSSGGGSGRSFGGGHSSGGFGGGSRGFGGGHSSGGGAGRGRH